MRKRWSQGLDPLCPPSRGPQFSACWSAASALPWLLPLPHLPKAKETEPLLQGHCAWPGRSSDLNPGPLAPVLPHFLASRLGLFPG